MKTPTKKKIKEVLTKSGLNVSKVYFRKIAGRGAPAYYAYDAYKVYELIVVSWDFDRIGFVDRFNLMYEPLDSKLFRKSRKMILYVGMTPEEELCSRKAIRNYRTKSHRESFGLFREFP